MKTTKDAYTISYNVGNGSFKNKNIPMPSRIDRFGLMMSLEFTRNISPIYRWFVGTKTLHNSSSSLSFCSQQTRIEHNVQIKK